MQQREWISKQEMMEIIDGRARRVVGMSGEEFVRRREEFNWYKEKPYIPGLTELLMLTKTY